MKIGELLAMELEQESIATRKVIERLPDDKFGWKPHEKSMELGPLASHVVNNLGWTGITIETDELDFAGMEFEAEEFTNSSDCVAGFDSALSKALGQLREVSDEELMKNWTLREGEKVHLTLPKAAVVRSFVINHGIHHRAQLAMYLRLNDVPVPQIYGPSADEPDM
ncbi:MAG: hypothetical protein DWQ47_11340 [Acidobacteria bacterium]|nr:MAG: hypothetical protein DWQ32_13755 [Acidobacteriota bacterium]REJ98171.1 MAG: hypothetical protein DWQ38_16555 [Acidobacteriota bacterium]REK16914.1 MAG: hypothetical protein DWQ43_01600 [Acidobacteriota bacterium]REK42825.1 MAG: hypothetical protein DWQ47_11340 [Acidobacteriota bacterium]